MLDEPNVVAPGQACVLYDGPRVLAGGFIRSTLELDRDARAVDSAEAPA
jgi:tRNA-specific 2-thiouridylase